MRKDFFVFVLLLIILHQSLGKHPFYQFMSKGQLNETDLSCLRRHFPLTLVTVTGLDCLRL